MRKEQFKWAADAPVVHIFGEDVPREAEPGKKTATPKPLTKTADRPRTPVQPASDTSNVKSMLRGLTTTVGAATGGKITSPEAKILEAGIRQPQKDEPKSIAAKENVVPIFSQKESREPGVQDLLLRNFQKDSLKPTPLPLFTVPGEVKPAVKITPLKAQPQRSTGAVQASGSAATAAATPKPVQQTTTTKPLQRGIVKPTLAPELKGEQPALTGTKPVTQPKLTLKDQPKAILAPELKEENPAVSTPKRTMTPNTPAKATLAPEQEERTPEQKVVNWIADWENRNNIFLENYNARFGGRKGDYTDAYVGDAQEYLEKAIKETQFFEAEKERILEILTQNSSTLDPELVDSVMKTLNEGTAEYEKIRQTAQKDAIYWAQFGDEAGYKAAPEAEKLSVEIEELQELYAQIEELYNEYVTITGSAAYNTNPEAQAKAKELANKIFALNQGKYGAYIHDIPNKMELALLEMEKRYAELTGGPREATLGDILFRSAAKGYNNARYGEESFKEMEGLSNEKDTYRDKLDSDKYNFKSYNRLGRAASNAVEQIGTWARSVTHPLALGTGAAAAGAVALSGQAGPQAVTAEEIVTVPVAFWRGNKIGRTAQMFMMEAGHAYNEMLEAGIPEKTARKLALAVGTVNASLEMFQVDELLDAYKVVKKSGATPNITKRILNELAVRGIDLGIEVGTDVLQDGVTIAGTQAGSKIANGKWAYSAEEIDERLKNTAKDSLSTFGMMNIPAVSKNIYGITQNRKVGWDGRVAVTDADGSKVTVGGKTYELIGLDENGSKVYQDVEVLKEQAEAESKQTAESESVSQEESALKETEMEENPEWFAAAIGSAEASSADSRDNLTSVAKGHIMDLQSGFMCFPEGDPLIENSKNVAPKEGFFDVAMHGSPTAVAFGGREANMSPRLLAEVIRHNPNYHGENIRLLCCSTGLQVDGAYCFAEELANALGVTVEAPNMEVYTDKKGGIKVGEYSEGQMIPYKPNKRRRIK